MGPGFVAKPRPPKPLPREKVLSERTRIANARCAKALTLRYEGWRLKDIAKEMGVSVSRASQLVDRAVWRAQGKLPETKWIRASLERLAKARQQAADREAAMAEFKASVARWDAAEDARQVRIRRAGYDITDPAQRTIVRAHAEQQLWRAFVEPNGAWRRPMVGPYRSLHDWLDWRGSAGVTYRDVPGQWVPEWRVSV